MIKIEERFSSIIPALSDDEYQQLEANCIKDGIRDPIVLWDGVIIDGHNRYKIAQAHGLDYTTTSKEFASVDAVKEWMILHQFGRRNLSTYHRSLLALQLESLLAPAAAARQARKPNQAPATDNSVPTILSEQNPETRETLARVAGVGPATISKVKVLRDNAPQATRDKLATGEISIDKAYQEVRREEKKQNQEMEFKAIEDDNARDFKGLYDVIVIDPPWPMVKIPLEKDPDEVPLTYPTMSVDEITAMELPAKESCHVFMWTTHKYLPASFDIFKAWGVKYVLTMVWHKGGGMQPFGLPAYNCEFILYGRLGTPKFKETTAFPVCFNAKRTGHSKKPTEFYELLNRVTVGKRIDMFNRRPIEGFDVWGNQS